MNENNVKRNIYLKMAKQGSALALVLVMVAIVSIILTSLLTYVSSQLNYSNDRVERERAFQIAEAGVYYYRWYLAHQVSTRNPQQLSDFWQNEDPIGVDSPYEAEFKDPEGGGIGRYMLEVERPALGSTIVIVKSTGWTYAKPTAKRIVQVRFRRPSWSEYVVLANDNMRFGQGTTIVGKIHSNKGIRFDAIATNIVSSSLPQYDDPDHCEVAWRWVNGNQVCDFSKDEFGVHTHVNVPPGSGVNESFRASEAPPNPIPSRPDVFQSGRIFPASQMDFGSVVSDISFMRSQANVKYDNTGKGRFIKLYANGTMDVCKVNSINALTNSISNFSKNSGSGTCNSCSGTCLTNLAIPNNGIIFVANNIWLEGTINNKKITIVAAELSDEPGYLGGNKNVYLGTNNLLYTNSDGRDIIGIIAQKDIEVIRNSLTNLTIDAALLAKDGRVGRLYYDGIRKNSITINGSITTNLRYGFAYTDNTGYDIRNLNFDNNLLYFPPPYFPTGTEYFIDLWDEL